MANPRFAIIVVTYRRDEELDESLRGVMRQTVGRSAMEVCVVHNGGSERARQRWLDRVDVWVDTERNLGCAGGRNRGAEATSAPILVFVDDDGIPAPGFVAELDAVLTSRPDAVAVRGRAVALHHPILTTMCTHYDRGPEICEDNLTLEGASAIRRSAFEGAGGYDATRAFHEGLELSARLLEQREDAKILYTPHAVLAHDYLQGLGHAFRKAKAISLADDRLHEEVDPRVLAVKKRRLTIKDGRRPWQRAVGRPLLRGFRYLVSFYRLRNKLLRGS